MAMAFVLLTKDNPFLQSNLKTIKSEQGQRERDFVKHLGIVGAAFFMLATI